MKVTTDMLLKLLHDNSDTKYGRRYGFADIHSIEDYQRKVPVVVYDQIALELERMMRGEKNVLTAYPFGHFNETSGTIGTPKVVPMTDPQEKVFARYSQMIMYGILAEAPDLDWMDGRAFCTSGGTCRTLDSGLTVGEAAAKIADSIQGGRSGHGHEVHPHAFRPDGPGTPGNDFGLLQRHGALFEIHRQQLPAAHRRH